jgi:sulfite exporter TauE/SafE
MFLIGLGALLVLCGILYMARAAIWRGPLSGPDSSRPVRDTLEPPRRGVGFLGLGTNWPGIILMAVGAGLLLSGASF